MNFEHDAWDIVGVVGFLCIVIGVSLLSVPAALIVAGTLLLIGAGMANRKRGKP